MEQAEESVLVQLWINGDHHSGEILFRRYEPLLVRFFRNKISTYPEDLVQETLAAAVVSRLRFEGRASFRAFLLSIAQHHLFRHYRKRRLERKHLDFNATSVADLAPSPSVLLGEQREQRLLLEALRHIPLTFQIVLELHYWEDLSGVEIADALGVPVDTVYSRIRKAKRVLRKKLDTLAKTGVSRAPSSAEGASSIQQQSLAGLE